MAQHHSTAPTHTHASTHSHTHARRLKALPYQVDTFPVSKPVTDLPSHRLLHTHTHPSLIRAETDAPPRRLYRPHAPSSPSHSIIPSSHSLVVSRVQPPATNVILEDLLLRKVPTKTPSLPRIKVERLRERERERVREVHTYTLLSGPNTVIVIPHIHPRYEIFFLFAFLSLAGSIVVSFLPHFGKCLRQITQSVLSLITPFTTLLPYYFTPHIPSSTHHRVQSTCPSPHRWHMEQPWSLGGVAWSSQQNDELPPVPPDPEP